tara:strand:+ start:2976 stop:3188 length:213 start_codon:yes stop_codon:yes gene_type:complete
MKAKPINTMKSRSLDDFVADAQTLRTAIPHIPAVQEASDIIEELVRRLTFDEPRGLIRLPDALDTEWESW